MSKQPELLCGRAPKGYRCYKPFLHKGPCPAYPTTWTSIKLWFLHRIRS